ncbi:hypothetical protein FACS1894172_10820 [Spirochaetia bacterium]|nr:hypothetical protein FACS1894172_10820 [Spirochaetia bacterium]
MKYQNIREEELKNKIAADFFEQFDCTKVIGNVGFTVTIKNQSSSFFNHELMWAEVKKSTNADIYESFVQLILTIGKSRTFDNNIPPAFLGAFDAEKIAFIPYNTVQNIFYQNDFNWNVRQSDHNTKEFQQIYGQVKDTIEISSMLFNYEKDEKKLHVFIKINFVAGKSDTTKLQIDKNNFINIYHRWLETVKPTIAINWEGVKKHGIIDGDFYLADLLSSDNSSIKENLYIVLNMTHYEAKKSLDTIELFRLLIFQFKDGQKAYTQFWNKYERPPKEEYWDYIIEHRGLLVPQYIRERKGSFFTPRIWVEVSQKYIADVFGEDWQDNYYIWDCAAGTGNLLAGLINKDNIWASTLDKQDVDVMYDRIKNGANLLENHMFQFDFLNDSFDKLPKELHDIIHDEEKRKKLIIYINPPYAEASNRKTIVAKGENKSNVAMETKSYKIFSKIAGTATRELFTQFFLRIYTDISDCKLASFSTLKYISSQYFIKFREYFRADFLKGFICPANSFDNVMGNFPIGFLIWDLSKKQKILSITTDVFLNDNLNVSKKTFYSYDKGVFIIDWLKNYHDKKSEAIAFLRMQGTDIQNNLGIFVTNNLSKNDIVKHLFTKITKNNLIVVCIYFTVRKVIHATWLNDRDQFLFPNDGYKIDSEFQNDCFTYTLFNNNIQSKYGINYWIPFTEQGVNASGIFESHFMTDFITGKIEDTAFVKREFSPGATAVFNAGRALWRYYHSMPYANVNASFYDIREYFQKRDEKGRMKNKSSDEIYNQLLNTLRDALKALTQKIQPKVYEYGFLKE